MPLFLFYTSRCRDIHRHAVLQHSYSWKRETNGLPTQGGQEHAGDQPNNWRAPAEDWQASLFFTQRSPTNPPSRAPSCWCSWGRHDNCAKGPSLRTQTRPAIELVSGEKGLRPILVGAFVPESVDAPEAAMVVIEFVLWRGGSASHPGGWRSCSCSPSLLTAGSGTFTALYQPRDSTGATKADNHFSFKGAINASRLMVQSAPRCI